MFQSDFDPDFDLFIVQVRVSRDGDPVLYGWAGVHAGKHTQSIRAHAYMCVCTSEYIQAHRNSFPPCNAHTPSHPDPKRQCSETGLPPPLVSLSLSLSSKCGGDKTHSEDWIDPKGAMKGGREEEEG